VLAAEATGVRGLTHWGYRASVSGSWAVLLSLQPDLHSWYRECWDGCACREGRTMHTADKAYIARDVAIVPDGA
jgi:hypothetical protein